MSQISAGCQGLVLIREMIQPDSSMTALSSLVMLSHRVVDGVPNAELGQLLQSLRRG
jgi:hypothetical protein